MLCTHPESRQSLKPCVWSWVGWGYGYLKVKGVLVGIIHNPCALPPPKHVDDVRRRRDRRQHFSTRRDFVAESSAAVRFRGHLVKRVSTWTRAATTPLNVSPSTAYPNASMYQFLHPPTKSTPKLQVCVTQSKFHAVASLSPLFFVSSCPLTTHGSTTAVTERCTQ